MLAISFKYENQLPSTNTSDIIGRRRSPDEVLFSAHEKMKLDFFMCLSKGAFLSGNHAVKLILFAESLFHEGHLREIEIEADSCRIIRLVDRWNREYQIFPFMWTPLK